VVLAATTDPGHSGEEVPLLRDRVAIDGAAAAYVCEHFACRRPVTEPAELEALLAASPEAERITP
jgi:uncharacterized protein YyaL (SSP411 family)